LYVSQTKYTVEYRTLFVPKTTVPILNVEKPLRNLDNIVLKYNKMQKNIIKQNICRLTFETQSKYYTKTVWIKSQGVNKFRT